MSNVKQTEYRIPFGDPRRLGEVGSLVYPTPLSDPGCSLVSFLTAPLTMGSTNTYVVFVTDAQLRGQVDSYAWTVSELWGPGATDAKPIAPLGNHPAVLEYTPASSAPIIISVTLKDQAGVTLRQLELRQAVRPPYHALELLIQASGVTIDGLPVPPGAVAALAPATSREVLNDLFGYIRDAFLGLKPGDKTPPVMPGNIVALKFLAAVVWLQVHRAPKNKAAADATFTRENQLRNPGLENIGDLLNGEHSWALGTELTNPTGVTLINAAVAAMFLNKPAAPPPAPPATPVPYTTFYPLPLDKKLRENTLQTILDAYNKLPLDDKTDLYNLFRFPKSNIWACFEILNTLKNRQGRYSAMTTQDFFTNDDAIAVVASEYVDGAIDATPDKVTQNEFGKSVKRIIGSPVFSLGFGGDLDLVVEGEVHDEAEPARSMVGARVDVYSMQLHLDADDVPCFRRFEGKATAPATEKELLKKGDYQVLEIRRRGPSTYPNDDLVKVRAVSNKLDLNEGWVVVKSGATWKGTLSSQLVKFEPAIAVGNDNKFKFTLHAPQPVFVRTVKEPDNGRGYFDGQVDQAVPGLPVGWVLPPMTDVVIRQRPAKNMVRESDIVGLLDDWMNYEYGIDANGNYTLPCWPTDSATNSVYYVAGFTQSQANREIVCSTFVEGIVVQAWRTAAGMDWSVAQNNLSQLVGTAAELFSADYDPFSSAWVYAERIIAVSKNPTSVQTISVSIAGEAVSFESETTPVATASKLCAALRGVPALASKFDVIRGRTSDSVLALRAKPPLEEPDFSIDFHAHAANFYVSSPIFPATRIDLSAASPLPGWLVIQSYATWDTAAQTAEGHNYFVVATDSRSGKILVLEANGRWSKNTNPPGRITVFGMNGPGLRSILNADTGLADLDEHVVSGVVTPNGSHHWLEKGTWTWSQVIGTYSAKHDGNNDVGAVRLKVYDCQWAVPYLYETSFDATI